MQSTQAIIPHSFIALIFALLIILTEFWYPALWFTILHWCPKSPARPPGAAVANPLYMQWMPRILHSSNYLYSKFCYLNLLTELSFPCIMTISFFTQMPRAESSPWSMLPFLLLGLLTNLVIYQLLLILYLNSFRTNPSFPVNTHYISAQNSAISVLLQK